MKFIMAQSDIEFNRVAANFISRQILKNPSSVLALDVTLATESVYSQLVDFSEMLKLDWSDVRVCSTYEFIGIDETNEISVHHRLHNHLCDKININRENIFTPTSIKEIAQISCKDFSFAINSLGEIDLLVIELGDAGTIVLNEPSTPLNSEVYVADVEKNIFNDKVSLSSNSHNPSQGITFGIKQIMLSQKILLLVRGSEKARIIKDFSQGNITTLVPASILQLHPNLTVLLDEGAASMMW